MKHRLSGPKGRFRWSGSLENEYLVTTMSDHTLFLNRCHELAERAGAEGESAVGSVLVLDGKIIGEGSEKKPATKRCNPAC